MRLKVLLGMLTVSAIAIITANYNREKNKDYLKDKLWVWVSGAKIGKGDFVEFSDDDHMFQFNNDTFFYNGNAKAILIWNNRITKRISIRSISTGQPGMYQIKGHSISDWLGFNPYR